MESTRLASPRTVSANAEGLVSRGGLVWLAETSDLCGLTAGLDDAFAGLPRRVHRPGRTMGQMMLALADGATAQVDVGAGLRVSLPFAGVLRLDYAHGLRDGADAWSVGWTR